MEIRQILIRPAQQLYVVQFQDVAGRPGQLEFSTEGNTAIAQIVSEAESQLPAPEDHPAKEEVEKEIAALEERVAELKQSIGAT